MDRRLRTLLVPVLCLELFAGCKDKEPTKTGVESITLTPKIVETEVGEAVTIAAKEASIKVTPSVKDQNYIVWCFPESEINDFGGAEKFVKEYIDLYKSYGGIPAHEIQKGVITYTMSASETFANTGYLLMAFAWSGDRVSDISTFKFKTL